MKRPRLTGVYVHLPFCDVKCAYCDFYSLAKRHVPAEFWISYCERLLVDLENSFAVLCEDTAQPVLASVFFGGGTPSKAPAFVIERVLEALQNKFQRRLRAIEITAEANPESLVDSLLAEWRRIGINRISIGMQSRDERTLKYLGRLYSRDAYGSVLQRVRTAGFENFNVDFITGVPGQKLESTLDDLHYALENRASHLSVYQLTVENGTVLKQRIAAGKLKTVSDSRQVRQMAAAIDFLEARGFSRYEISNFSQPARMCLHNLIYWSGRPYLGLGVSAHGFTGRRRFFHARSLESYIAGADAKEDSGADKRDLLINRLRLLRPLHRARILSLFTTPQQRAAAESVLDKAVRVGWLAASGKCLYPLAEGLKFTDTLIADLWQL